jgi:hypothetical protein
MTQDEIIEMARQAGGIDMTNTLAGKFTAWIGTGTPEFLERFAKLVEQHERDACAKVIEECNWPKWADATDVRDVFAEAIRARGQA